ncbi:reverse transcriptase [Paramuricea clavata]|uniref:Reverse transcriptase n=1 Tax=Paramuricea clavata TaxID=317549 RepID=A0A7D9E2B7_PARCT|nr:reverse transcriptase [Paramuricea clavata]
MVLWKKAQNNLCHFCLNVQTLQHIVSSCKTSLDEGRYTWRHNSVLKHLATYISSVRRNFHVYANISGFDNPSVITGCNDRPGLVISDNNQNIYVIELTIGFETNMAKNCLRKRERYKDLCNFLKERFNKVMYFNLRMGAIGVLSHECKQFYDFLDREVLNPDQLPLKWVMFAGKLPFPMHGHKTFVYKGKLIVVRTYCERKSGKDGRQDGGSVVTHYLKIYEVLHTPPYSAKELYSCTIEQETDHGDFYEAELINDELFIFKNEKKYTQPWSTEIYNLDTNECREMPSAQYSLYKTTTVVRRHHVIFVVAISQDNNDAFKTNVDHEILKASSQLIKRRQTKHCIENIRLGKMELFGKQVLMTLIVLVAIEQFALIASEPDFKKALELVIKARQQPGNIDYASFCKTTGAGASKRGCQIKEMDDVGLLVCLESHICETLLLIELNALKTIVEAQLNVLDYYGKIIPGLKCGASGSQPTKE